MNCLLEGSIVEASDFRLLAGRINEDNAGDLLVSEESLGCDDGLSITNIPVVSSEVELLCLIKGRGLFRD